MKRNTIIGTLLLGGIVCVLFFFTHATSSFKVTPSKGTVPLEVIVRTEGNPESFMVNFGDGSKHSHWFADDANPDELSMKHTYAVPGEYILILMQDGKRIADKKVVVE